MVLDEQRAKKVSCGGRVNYVTGNIIGFVVLKMTDAWNTIIIRLGHTSLSETLAPYLWFDQDVGQFRFLERTDGFSPSVQLTSFQNSAQPAPSGPLISQQASSRSSDMDSAYRFLAYGLLTKLKKILTNSALYNQNLQDIPKWPDIASLSTTSGGGLPYVFAEIDDKTMSTLKLTKPVPFPLTIISVEDT